MLNLKKTYKFKIVFRINQNYNQVLIYAILSIFVKKSIFYSSLI